MQREVRVKQKSINAHCAYVQKGQEIAILLPSITFRMSFPCVNLRFTILDKVAGFPTQMQASKEKGKQNTQCFLDSLEELQSLK